MDVPPVQPTPLSKDQSGCVAVDWLLGRRMRAFMTLQVKEGVELGPMSGPPPPTLQNRPRGIYTMMTAFEAHRFDRGSLRRCQFPVFFAYGDLTAIHQEVWAAVLSRLLPDIHIRRFDGIHHFVPPSQIYHAEHVKALRELWGRHRLNE